MKLIYGYHKNGKFIIATTDHLVSLGAGDPGENVIELDRDVCQKIAKHMQFGRKGDIRTLVIEEQEKPR